MERQPVHEQAINLLFLVYGLNCTKNTAFAKLHLMPSGINYRHKLLRESCLQLIRIDGALRNTNAFALKSAFRGKPSYFPTI